MNFNSFQQLIARILLVSLNLQSCGGLNNPPIPIQEEQTAREQTHTQEIIPQTNIGPLLYKQLTADGGHAVTFYEEAGELKADIEMNVPQGFSKNYEGVNVYVEQSAELSALPRLSEQAQQRRIHLQPAHAGKPAKIVIYKGAGLMGGGDSEDEGEAEEDELEEEPIPNECFCPITQEIMEDPVIAQDGHTYERQAIKRWLDMGKWISPKTGARLLSSELTPNHTMRSLIQDLKAQIPVLARHKLDMRNIEIALKLREEEVEERLIQKGQLVEKESQERLRLEEELQQKTALLNIIEQGEKGKSHHPGLVQSPLQETYQTPQLEKLTDKRELRKYFFKGMLEITPKNYQILLKHSLSSEAAFYSYDKGLSVKGWPVSMGMDVLVELLVSFSKVTRFKMEINWDKAGQEEEVGEAIARSLQFYEQLTCLELPRCRLSDASWQEIVACIPQPICLKELEVKGNLLTEEVVKNIPVYFPNLTRLERDLKRDVLAPKEEVYTTMNSITVQEDTRKAKEGEKGTAIKDNINEAIDCYMLGIKYGKGDGVEQDYNEAIKWYQKAADQGYAQAQFNLGVMYANGKGVVKDDAKAVAWFQKAAEHGHLEAANLLVELGADIHAKDYLGSTVLYQVIQKGNLELTKLLVELGADINAKDKYGLTTLHLAAKKGYIEIVKLLIEKGANVNINITDSNNVFSIESESILVWSIQQGHAEIANLLIEKGADINFKTGFFGCTPLHLAAQGGHLEIVKLLLEKGAEVNDKNKDGKTPLHCAAEQGHVEIVKLLLEKGADANTKDGASPLNCAAKKGHLEVVMLLLEHGSDVINAKDFNNIVKLLIEKGADVNAKNNEGFLPS